jgi:hypothetical protein
MIRLLPGTLVASLATACSSWVPPSSTDPHIYETTTRGLCASGRCARPYLGGNLVPMVAQDPEASTLAHHGHALQIGGLVVSLAGVGAEVAGLAVDVPGRTMSTAGSALVLGGAAVAITGVVLMLDGVSRSQDAMNVFNWNLDHPQTQARLDH